VESSARGGFKLDDWAAAATPSAVALRRKLAAYGITVRPTDAVSSLLNMGEGHDMQC